MPLFSTSPNVSVDCSEQCTSPNRIQGENRETLRRTASPELHVHGDGQFTGRFLMYGYRLKVRTASMRGR